MRPDSRRRAPSGIGRTQRSHTVNHCHCPVGRQLPPAVHQLRPAIGSGHYPLLYRTYVRLDGPTQRGPASSRNPRRGRPLRVLAGAGTGKTTTLSARVAWLLANGTPPERILLLTFTRRGAARQMLDRTAGMLAVTTRELPQRAGDRPCDGGNVSRRLPTGPAKILPGTRDPRRILGHRSFRRR